MKDHSTIEEKLYELYNESQYEKHASFIEGFLDTSSTMVMKKKIFYVYCGGFAYPSILDNYNSITLVIADDESIIDKLMFSAFEKNTSFLGIPLYKRSICYCVFAIDGILKKLYITRYAFYTIKKEEIIMTDEEKLWVQTLLKAMF